MRITRDQLISTAQDTVKRATFGSNDLVCAYLTGSLTHDNPLIGGTTDIDLIYIHSVEVPMEREIIPITEDYHLDIAHFPQSYFSQPRKLRSDAWVGSFLCDYPILLHDTNHWFDFLRSGAFAHFYQPNNIIKRVRPFIETARGEWLVLRDQLLSKAHFNSLYTYLRIIKNAVNAISCLTSVPLTDRRLLIDFPRSAQAINKPGLAGGLVDLIVPIEPIEPDWDIWINIWDSAYSSIQQIEKKSISFSECRKAYYKKAILGLKDENSPAALWVLLWTWARMASIIPVNNSSQRGYMDLLVQLNLDAKNFVERINSLDQFLDAIEETIDEWQIIAGV